MLHVHVSSFQLWILILIYLYLCFKQSSLLINNIFQFFLLVLVFFQLPKERTSLFFHITGHFIQLLNGEAMLKWSCFQVLYFCSKLLFVLFKFTLLQLFMFMHHISLLILQIWKSLSQLVCVIIRLCDIIR